MNMMKCGVKKPALWVFLILVTLVSGCTSGKGGSLSIYTPEETRVMNAARISDIIGKINSQPGQYLSQQVEIVGYFRGWDLLKEVKEAPPVTRSDWVIADNSGAIYVTGNAPPNLNPASAQDTKKVIRLVATVEQNENGVYLQAISVELIPIE